VTERKRRLKITFVLPGYPRKPIGGFRVVYEYANNLVARGHWVSVAHVSQFPHCEPSASRSLKASFLNKAKHLRDMFCIPQVKWQHIDSCVRMLFLPFFGVKLLPDSDVLFATGWQTVEDVLSCPESKGRKYYLIQHYESWLAPAERIDATWHEPLKKVMVAEWLVKKGLEMGVPPDDMIHIPNAVNHSIFKLKNPVENRTVRVAMSYGPDWKGGEDGIEALMLAKTEFPSLQAVAFCGYYPRPVCLPPWMEYFQNPQQRVLIDTIYNQSSIFLCPSWTEGWGLPAAEAMACGCAVVSTDNGGIRDYATQNETALLSSPKNPDDLAANIAKLLIDDGFRRQLANNGHQCIKEFNWERSTDMLENYLLNNT